MSEMVLQNGVQQEPKKIKLSNRAREILFGLLFVSPWIVGFLVFGLYPIVYSLFLSFNKVTIALPWDARKSKSI